MTTQRSYNEPLSFKGALEEFETVKGEQFDPEIVDAAARFINRNYITDENWVDKKSLATGENIIEVAGSTPVVPTKEIKGLAYKG